MLHAEMSSVQKSLSQLSIASWRTLFELQQNEITLVCSELQLLLVFQNGNGQSSWELLDQIG